MSGIDKLISSALSTKIKKRMDSDVLRRIEQKLFTQHGMSIKLSIEHFHNFTDVVRNNSSIDIGKFGIDCINEIMKIEKISSGYFITIIDPDLSNLILELFGEKETREIITSLLGNEITIPQILKESKIPKTSLYRKIENLISSGLIIESGNVLSKSKKISRLQCIFQEIRLDIKKEKIIVNGIISQKIFEESTSMKSILQALT